MTAGLTDLLSGTPVQALAVFAVALGGLAQSSTGMGFSLVAAPALILTAGARDGVATVLVLAVLASVIPLTRDWRNSRPREATRLLVPTLLFTPLVAYLLRGVDTRWLALGAGTGVLVGVALLASGWRSPRLKHLPGTTATGLSSAILNVIGGVGGPPIGLYAANADWAPHHTRATLQSFFLVQNIVTVAVVGIVLPSWQQVLALVLGTGAGMLAAPRLPVWVSRAGVLGVSVVGGVALILGSL